MVRSTSTITKVFVKSWLFAASLLSSQHKELYGEQAGKFSYCVFGQGTYWDAFTFE